MPSLSPMHHQQVLEKALAMIVQSKQQTGAAFDDVVDDFMNRITKVELRKLITAIYARNCVLVEVKIDSVNISALDLGARIVRGYLIQEAPSRYDAYVMQLA